MTPPAEPERSKNHRFPGEIISHGVWLYSTHPVWTRSAATCSVNYSATSWRDSTTIVPVSVYHCESYAERYSRYRLIPLLTYSLSRGSLSCTLAVGQMLTQKTGLFWIGSSGDPCYARSGSTVMIRA